MLEYAGTASPLSQQGLNAFTAATGTSEADLWAVLSVETSGCGFLVDRRPKILFERHRFHVLTGGIYDRAHADISAPFAGGYGLGGANQYNRLCKAVALNRQAALKSASWGIGQIMGEDFAHAGYHDVEAMVAGMVESEDRQLAAMAAFLKGNRLATALAQNDWIRFALGYNGPDYARNNYDGLLRQFHSRFKAGPLPDLAVRSAQVVLTYRGYDAKGIDGLLGHGTQVAIRQFQSHSGLKQTGCVDAALQRALAAG